ncbi:hypothetical protein PTKIN_Ptkin11bG0132100 [Pterospermum kingtungense]
MLRILFFLNLSMTLNRDALSNQLLLNAHDLDTYRVGNEHTVQQNPRNKIALIDFTLRVIYFEAKAPRQISKVSDSLHKLYKVNVDEHKAAVVACIGNSMQTNLQASDTDKVSTFSGIDKEKVVMTRRSKYEQYVKSVNTI